MFRAVYGTAGVGKTGWLYAEIKQNIEAGKRSCLLVPEQFSLYTEQHVIASFGIQAQKLVKVYTFSRLCNLVFSELGPLRMRYIDNAGKLLVAQRTMQLLEKKLSYLGRNVHQKGFGQVIVSTLSSFKRYGLTPANLSEAADQVQKEDLKQKLSDLRLIFETYQTLIEEQNSDAEDNLALACPKIAGCSLRGGTLYISQFRSFTPHEYLAIGELMKKMDVCISLCTDTLAESGGIFDPVAGTYRQLCDTARAAGVEIGKSVALTQEVKFSKKPALRHLKDQFFSIPAQAYQGGQDAVHILTPRNYYQEAELTARLILNLCRTEGYRYRDFLILARDTQNYNRILPAVFGQNGINVFLDSRRSIRLSPLVRTLCAVLEILAYGFSYERVMTILRCGIAGSSLTREEVDIFENYLLATDPSHQMWNADRWDYNPRQRYDLEQINLLRDTVLKPIREIGKSLTGLKTGGQICDALTKWMDQAGLADSIKRRCNYFAQNRMPELSEEYRQVWNAVLAVLAELRGLLGSDFMTYQKFYELFASACGGVEVGLAPQTMDRVIFSEIDRFRSSDAKVVIVLGMTEGVFPKGYTSEGLISENERDELAGLGFPMSPSLNAIMREEQLIIYNVLTAASEKVYLSAPLADKSGKALVPSSIIRKVREELFPSMVPYHPDEDQSLSALLEGKSSVFQALAAELAPCGGRPERLAPWWSQIYRFYATDAEYAGRLDTLTSAIRNAGRPERITPETVQNVYGETLALSATKLEKYNSCAFKFFLEYGLVARERDKAGFDSRGTGSVLHSVLCRYFEQAKEENWDYAGITKEKCMEVIGGLVESEARTRETELLYESSYYYRYMVMRMKGIAAATAWDIVGFYKSSSFSPYGYELKIGSTPDAAIPPVEIRGREGELIATVDGFIDRADCASIHGQNYISIVDYKSSAHDMDETLSAAGVQIQPLFYASAICKNTGGASVAAMLYMNMHDPLVRFNTEPTESELEEKVHASIPLKGWICEDVVDEFNGTEGYCPRENFKLSKGSVFTREELDEKISEVSLGIKKTAQEILSGNIEIRPFSYKRFDACAFCPYRAVCGKHN